MGSPRRCGESIGVVQSRSKVSVSTPSHSVRANAVMSMSPSLAMSLRAMTWPIVPSCVRPFSSMSIWKSSRTYPA